MDFGKPMYRREGTTVLNVSDLLNAEGNEWDFINKVNNSLLPIDAKEVFKIPLGNLDHDTWAPNAEKHGLYSVKSATLLAKNSKADSHYRRNTAVCSNAEDKNIWSKLWKLSVPPKRWSTNDENLEHKASHIGNRFDGVHFALEDEAPAV